jgi:hypothetical protein
MKRLLLSTMACAAALCGFGASAHASIPVKMAPVALQLNTLVPIIDRIIVIEVWDYIPVAVDGDLPVAPQALERVDQAAEFDRA